MKSTRKRQEAILEIIKQNEIEDQLSLVELIKKKYGIETNQSIVSRDLRQLGVSKHQVGTRMVYELKEHDASKEILRLAIASVKYNETMILVKTLPGLSNFVGDFLDMHDQLNILGTMAGENVVFVVPQSVKNIKETYNEVCNVLCFKGPSIDAKGHTQDDAD